MKRYLTNILLIMCALILIFGLNMDGQWEKAFVWGLFSICLMFAAYFTKYIPNDKKGRNERHSRSV